MRDGDESEDLSPSNVENPNPAASTEASVDSFEESGSEVTGSAISGGSSAWTESSGAPSGDRTSRRALILQMARARMKNNKDSPVKSNKTAMKEEDGKTVNTADFDLTGDLD
ncbi:MAG: hypothetical protein SGARI_007952 [Bacillariaceae sp.]